MRWIIVLHVFLVCISVISSDDSEADILLDLKKSLSNATALSNWSKNVALCSGDKNYWNGLCCVKGNVYGVVLESMGLSGIINVESLTKMPSLRILSLSNNNFVGPFPSNINKISGLRAFYLSNNKFSGEIPGDAFNGMKFLRRVYLGNNNFTGKIPKSLVSLSKLVDLQLQNNKLEGKIPDFKQKNLIANFANSNLEGPIPPDLSDEPPSFFAGKFIILVSCLNIKYHA